VAAPAAPAVDVVVVGAGHNGLCCAALLAKLGLDVVVFEANERVGGAAATEELLPGFRFPTCAYALHALREEVVDELGLELDVEPLPPLHRSRTIVRRLATFFALDSFGGGFVVQAFIAYWFAHKFGASPQVLGAVFFAIALLQAVSFQAAVRLAERVGLLNTMVFTHLPSDVLLALIPLAPNLPSAIALLLARFATSQMDVPTRQAYVVAVVDPTERTAAAAYTNTARYVIRPVGPLAAGGLVNVWLGAPFVVAGALKIVYDAGLYILFRGVRVEGEREYHVEAAPP
jgi:phytoene dehydrogenase-like protein